MDKSNAALLDRPDARTEMTVVTGEAVAADISRKLQSTARSGPDYQEFMTVVGKKRYRTQQFLKRFCDVVLSTLGLLAISPILLLLALLVKVTSPGPVLYKSLRIGKNSKPFYMYKFRTMQTNADDLRDELRAKANLQGNLFKIHNDPRVTPFGAFLRKFSLDEFPQLLNVIRGEMSLVGPRPLPPDESQLFEDPYTLRFFVLPGVTGLWQVSGRSALDFKKFCELELTYLKNWSIGMDLGILFKTIPAVTMRRGSY